MSSKQSVTVDVNDLSKLRIIAHFEERGAHDEALQILHTIENGSAREIARALTNQDVDDPSAVDAARKLRTAANVLIRKAHGGAVVKFTVSPETAPKGSVGNGTKNGTKKSYHSVVAARRGARSTADK